eukprot:10567471-Alexandrium_andersonii.AAC.1
MRVGSAQPPEGSRDRGGSLPPAPPLHRAGRDQDQGPIMDLPFPAPERTVAFQGEVIDLPAEIDLPNFPQQIWQGPWRKRVDIS